MIGRTLTIVTMTLLGWATPLLAQVNGEGMKEGNIELLPMERPIAEYALLGIFLLVALGIGFYTSRRTND